MTVSFSSLVRWPNSVSDGMWRSFAGRMPERIGRVGADIGASIETWLRLLTASAQQRRPPGTADVFISFQRNNKATAATLAKKLTKRGYRVWWAGDLVATGDFRDEIERRLDAAKAVIVIWSPDAVRSKWVRAEAAHADDDNKLVNVHTPALRNPARKIPKPFGVTHAVGVADIAAIVASLEVLRVRPMCDERIRDSACKSRISVAQ